MEKLSKPKREEMATEREAKAIAEEARIISESQASGKGWWKVGTLYRKAIDGSVYVAMGYPNFKAWCEDYLKISLAKLKRCLREVTYLKDVPREKTVDIPEGNAYELSRMLPSLALTDEWLTLAASLPNGEFKKKADEAMGRKREKWFSITKLPESMREVYHAAIMVTAEATDTDLEEHPELEFKMLEYLLAAAVAARGPQLQEFLEGAELVEQITAEDPS